MKTTQTILVLVEQNYDLSTQNNTLHFPGLLRDVYLNLNILVATSASCRRIFGLKRDFLSAVSFGAPGPACGSLVISPCYSLAAPGHGLELQHPHFAVQRVFTSIANAETWTLLIHRQQQVNLLHRWTCDDLKVFSAVFLLKQGVQSLEYLLDVIPDRLEKDELRVSIG